MSGQAPTGFIEINGTPIHYEVRGAGHPLVLIHGGLADMRMWDDQMDAFAGRFRVLRFDLWGMGESPMPADEFSFPADIASLMGAVDMPSAYIVGLSLGGKIALDFALEHPSMVDALVLAAPGLGGYDFGEDIESAGSEIDALLEAGDIDGAVEREIQLWIDGPRRSPEQVKPSVRERTREMNRHNYAVYSEDDRERETAPAMERLADITAPSLVVVGDGDVPDMLAIAEILGRRLPRVQSAVIPNTAHHLTMEEPQTFNRLVLDFLLSLERSRA